jgi:hypothetical protein
VDGALVGAGSATKRLLLTPAANKTLPQLQIHLHKRVFAAQIFFGARFCF